MVRNILTRAGAITGAFALAAVGVVALGQGTAAAGQDTYTWSDGNDGLTRTISNVTPSAGDTITVWTTIQRNGGVVEYVQAAKDAHPACWKYVDGSAQVNGSAKGLDSSAVGDANNMGWQRVTGSWPIYPNISPRSVWFTMQYKIGADCPTGTPMKGSFFYSTSLGDGNENNVGPAVTVQAPVNQSTTTTAAAPSTAITGQSVNLTATVAPSAAGGTVQFMDNGQAVGSAVALSGGTATLPWTFTAAGSHSITAVYSGGAGYNGSTSAAQTVTVSDPAPVNQDTTTTLSVPGTGTTGQAVNLTATVAPSAAGGTVQFKDGGTNIGAPVAVAGGTATLSQTFTSAGAHSITAVYSGGTGYNGSTSAAQTVTVSDPAPVNQATTTTLTVPSTATTGQSVNLTATVAPSAAGGTVQFKDGGTNIGSAVAVAGGTATLSQTFTSAGAHSITAVYSGGTGYNGSTSAAQTVTVSAPAPTDQATSTTLTAPGTATTGQSVNLTATVAPAPNGGTVQFKDGGTNIGAAVTVSGGTATLPYTFSTAAAHSITAVYSGATGFTGSASTAKTVTVSDAAPTDQSTTTTLSVPATATAGQSVDLTATVAPSAAGGTVQFQDGGTDIGSPVSLSGGTATLSYIFTNTGARTITAVYSGASGYTGSTSAQQTVTVSSAGGGTPGGGHTGGSGSLSNIFGS